jgi:hypothetical protein
MLTAWLEGAWPEGPCPGKQRREPNAPKFSQMIQEDGSLSLNRIGEYSKFGLNFFHYCFSFLQASIEVLNPLQTSIKLRICKLACIPL